MFAQYFHDNLAGFDHTFTQAAPDEAAVVIAGPQLSQGEALAPLLDRYTADQGYINRRAVASQWSKYFFARLVIPALVAQLGEGCALDFAPANWSGCFAADGLPVAFVWSRRPDTCQDALDFRSLIDDALVPVVAALHAECRLAPRVFWSNAAVYFIWALGELENQARLPAERLARARALLDMPQRADGGLNPFYHAYKALPPGALDGDGQPATHCRRLCCLRDLDPQWDLCANCPRAVSYSDPSMRIG